MKKITLSICALLLSSMQLQALMITHRLVINPIQVCDDLGTICANPSLELFEAETDAIWMQAGIDIEFLPWSVMNDSD